MSTIIKTLQFFRNRLEMQLLMAWVHQGSHSDWKTWKNGKHFPVREKSGNFEKTGKVRENRTKYWKTQGI